MAHIHKGRRRRQRRRGGPFFANESPLDASSKSGCVQAKESVVKGMAANPANYYVNVHSPEFPKGAIRGQLVSGANGDQLAFTGGPMSRDAARAVRDRGRVDAAGGRPAAPGRLPPSTPLTDNH